MGQDRALRRVGLPLPELIGALIVVSALFTLAWRALRYMEDYL